MFWIVRIQAGSKQHHHGKMFLNFFGMESLIESDFRSSREMHENLMSTKIERMFRRISEKSRIAILRPSGNVRSGQRYKHSELSDLQSTAVHMVSMTGLVPDLETRALRLHDPISSYQCLESGSPSSVKLPLSQTSHRRSCHCISVPRDCEPFTVWMVFDL